MWLGAPDDPASVMVQCRLSGGAEPPAPPLELGGDEVADSGFFMDPIPPEGDSGLTIEPPAEPEAEPAPEAAPDFIIDPVSADAPSPDPGAPSFASEDEVFFVDEATPPPPPPAPPVEEPFFVADEVTSPPP